MVNQRHQINRLQQGFTLIEILAVVIIIGLIASIVTVALGDSNSDSDTRKEAQSLVQALEFVGEQAVLNGEIIAMFVELKDAENVPAQQWCYHWKRFLDQSWQDLPENTLSEHCIPVNVQLDMTIEDKFYVYDDTLEAQLPVLVFSPSGEATGVEIKIYQNAAASKGVGGAEPQHIDVDVMGDLHWRNKEEEDKRNER